MRTVYRLAEIELLTIPRDPDARRHFRDLAAAISGEDGRKCESCGNTYARTRDESQPHWDARRFCGRSCAGRWSAQRGAERRRQAKLEDLEWIVGTDSPERVAQRLGYSNVDNLRDVLHRWGREDLASKLERAS